MADYWVEPESLLSRVEVTDALVASPLLGSSTLGGTFSETRGFAFTLKSPGIAVLRDRHPVLGEFLDRCFHPRVRTALRRGWSKPAAANAWYLNVLQVPEGASVGAHVDATLREPSGDDTATPELVSVAHLRSPGGGALRLARGATALARLEARIGRVLHFRGELVHAVDTVTGAPPRLSLVMEHYRLGPAALDRLPVFATHSRTYFQSFLLNAR